MKKIGDSMCPSALQLQRLVAEAGAGVGHRQGRAALAGFGLDHLKI